MPPLPLQMQPLRYLLPVLEPFCTDLCMPALNPKILEIPQPLDLNPYSPKRRQVAQVAQVAPAPRSLVVLNAAQAVK